MSRHTPVVAATIALFALLTPSAASAQDESDQVMRALLTEIRALRLTLQQSAALDLRAKLLIERARMQEEAVRELQREVDGRAMSRSMGMEEEEPIDTMVEQLNTRLRAETDPAQRQQIESEIQMMQRRREMYARHQEKMRMYEQQMEARLAEEKGKLADIEREIMALEAEMSRLGDS